VRPNNRRRFLGNAFVLTTAMLRPSPGRSHEKRTNERRQVVDLDAPDADLRLASLARAGLERSWAGTAGPPQEHRARLQRELEAIGHRRASRQFLAAAAVARFARRRGIAVSPGRGAAPSSLVAHTLGVTGIDPLAHGLIFERFLHARSPTTPAICIDVCAERLGEVIDFAATDLGGLPEAAGDTTIFADLGLEIAGLPALTSLATAVDRINRGRNRPLDVAGIPLDDLAAYQRLGAGEAIALPHVQTGRWLPAGGPGQFEDIVAAIARSRPGLPRPGSGDQLHGLADGRAAEHLQVRPIVAATGGEVIYQEQAMRIAASVAGYSLGDADLFRRVLAKGHSAKIARERQRFLHGARGAGVSRTDAARIFSLLECAAPLTFNRSHAVACALIVYWASYLEAHHPGALPRLPGAPG
jgi:DNA polymerase III alpha subunit